MSLRSMGRVYIAPLQCQQIKYRQPHAVWNIHMRADTLYTQLQLPL